MHLRSLLLDTHAHMPPAQVLEDLSEQDAMRRIPNIPNSIGGIVAHAEFWQSLLLKRCRGEAAPFPSSAAPGWPEVVPGAWTSLRERFLSGIEDAAAFESQPDLLEKAIQPALAFPPLADYTVRDAVVHIANHNSHHLGQIITLRQLMGAWPPPGGSWTW